MRTCGRHTLQTPRWEKKEGQNVHQEPLVVSSLPSPAEEGRDRFGERLMFSHGQPIAWSYFSHQWHDYCSQCVCPDCKKLPKFQQNTEEYSNTCIRSIKNWIYIYLFTIYVQFQGTQSTQIVRNDFMQYLNISLGNRTFPIGSSQFRILSYDKASSWSKLQILQIKVFIENRRPHFFRTIT